MTPQDKVFTKQLLDNLEKQGFVLASKKELTDIYNATKNIDGLEDVAQVVRKYISE